MIDVTGSMSGVLAATKSMILEIVETSKKAPYPHAGWSLRIGFVAYRDFTIRPQFVVQDFTSSSDEFAYALGNITAYSDGVQQDISEDVFGGLELATMLSWESVTRTLIHIADAPCHGQRFHAPSDDLYAAGDPLDRDIKAMFTTLKTTLKVSVPKLNLICSRLEVCNCDTNTCALVNTCAYA